MSQNWHFSRIVQIFRPFPGGVLLLIVGKDKNHVRLAVTAPAMIAETNRLRVIMSTDFLVKDMSFNY